MFLIEKIVQQKKCRKTTRKAVIGCPCIWTMDQSRRHLMIIVLFSESKTIDIDGSVLKLKRSPTEFNTDLVMESGKENSLLVLIVQHAMPYSFAITTFV